ncbi:MAG: hypothetical protein U9O66_02725, partial [Patescibacteria group bacterium]|nr:hypothetical protein [Patescibacteria group bacterium]
MIDYFLVAHELSFLHIWLKILTTVELIFLFIIEERDLDFRNKMLKVRQVKGKKGRMTIMSKKVSDVLEKYAKNKKGD